MTKKFNSGDHDMLIPFLATQAWIRSLNYSIVDDWRQWYYNDQIAGYIYVPSTIEIYTMLVYLNE
jgi:hypothetical protein